MKNVSIFAITGGSFFYSMVKMERAPVFLPQNANFFSCSFDTIFFKNIFKKVEFNHLCKSQKLSYKIYLSNISNFHCCGNSIKIKVSKTCIHGQIGYCQWWIKRCACYVPYFPITGPSAACLIYSESLKATLHAIKKQINFQTLFFLIIYKRK